MEKNLGASRGEGTEKNGEKSQRECRCSLGVALGNSTQDQKGDAVLHRPSTCAYRDSILLA